MKILVCIKQVPDVNTGETLTIRAAEKRVEAERHPSFRLNRFDEYATELALRIRESGIAATIEVMTVGPDRSTAVLRRAMGMGLDHGIHIRTEDNEDLDPFQVSAWIAQVATGRAYDLVLAGVMSEDLMQAQVGPLIAERLSLPYATAVIAAEQVDNGRRIEVEREIEGGRRDSLSLPLPALLTIQTGIHPPRYPSLSNMLKAKKARLEAVDAATLSGEDPHWHLSRLDYPRKVRTADVLQGTLTEQAETLYRRLKEKSLLH
jgi:electron transfer flavoprotein beta subunit